MGLNSSEAERMLHESTSDSGLELKTTSIDRILECAVKVNWKDLTKSGRQFIHAHRISTGPQHSLDLKLWSSCKLGYCICWPSTGCYRALSTVAEQLSAAG